MPPKGYKSVSLPKGLLEEAEKLISELNEKRFHPYMNETDFVKDAIRRRIEELRMIYLLGEDEAPQ